MKKSTLVALAVVSVLGMNKFLNDRCAEVEYYNDETIPHKAEVGRYEDNGHIVLVVDNASPTDILMAEEQSRHAHAPIYKVKSDELPVDVVDQERRGMYIYGELDSFVMGMLETRGFYDLSY